MEVTSVENEICATEKKRKEKHFVWAKAVNPSKDGVTEMCLSRSSWGLIRKSTQGSYAGQKNLEK